MSTIAPTAVVDPTAQVGQDVTIGPGCVVAAGVIIGDGCELRANVYLAAGVELGRHNRCFANCVLGEEPQILGGSVGDTRLVIGDHNTFRENVTISPGSARGNGRTVIGHHNYFMIGSHIGHDCDVGDHAMIGNYAQVAGHCKLENHVWLSPWTGLQQFVTMGRFAYTGGFSAVFHDLPPFVRAAGAYPCTVRGLNVVGLRRAGFTPEAIAKLMEAYRRLFRRPTGEPFSRAVEELAGQDELDENVRHLVNFLRRSHQHRMGRYLELFR
ncbi:MAG: acyl-ACP--UDP-N-acetylglucosamine O-acyltransferase [Sedimentisphaerales bacterium]|nr:acyl-ACP--UDP-N-acetylglucosamine O-acyltransferase [Sedimentisphaerales bacterium]